MPKIKLSIPKKAEKVDFVVLKGDTPEQLQALLETDVWKHLKGAKLGDKFELEVTECTDTEIVLNFINK